ncbi:MAG: TetR/AcrR family transcriptional regulator [Rubrivivax sp.]
MGTSKKSRAAARAEPAEPADETLLLRRLPAQERGRAAFDAILSTAARLIEEGGIERLNTNLVAAESGINISTVYKYFPNKLAILATLFERQSAERTEVAFGDLVQLPAAKDWRALVDRTIDHLVERRRGQPGHVALLRAMRSSPELTELYAQASRRSAERLAELLRERAGLPRARSLMVARTVIELQVAMLDWWESDEGGRNPGIVREFKAVVRGYLGVYLET